MLLEPEQLARLDRLAFAARNLHASHLPGEHRSRRRGSSVNFVDWRPYVPGDDFRRIDYQIYARLDRLLVRLFEAEDELTTRVVVDASQSMSFGGKLQRALQIAAAIVYVSANRRNRARVLVIDGKGMRPSPWATSRTSAIQLFGWIEAIGPDGAADLPAGLRQLRSSGRLSGLTILISDLLTERWADTLLWLGGPREDAALVQVLSPEEREPPERGDLLIVDSESSATVEVSVSEQLLRQYRRRVGSWLAAVEQTARRRDIRYALVGPEQDLSGLIERQLRREGILQ